jgi:1,2-phenylacetyl-CoA epoxidase catalytic subunit
MSYSQGFEKKDYLSFDLPTEKFAESLGIEFIVAGKELIELKWLKDGSSSKLLDVDVDRAVPKQFLWGPVSNLSVFG